MRYYALTLTNSRGQILALGPNGFTPSTTGQPTFSSQVKNSSGNGTINNPAALNLEFDLPLSPYATFQGFQSIRVCGIGLAQIAQSANLNANPVTGAQGAGFTLVAGMARGLPLATAAAPYAGVIAQGTVLQAFGNWQNTNQTLELVIQSAGISPVGGIQLSWQPGQTVAAAIQAALIPAYPGYTVDVSGISSLIQSQSSVAMAGHYQSLDEFAAMILQQTQLIGANQTIAGTVYPGVAIVINGKRIIAYDGSAPGAAIALQFQDLIGQPTWIDPQTVNFKTVLRGDIQVGSQVTFPSGVISPYALTTAAAAIPGAPARSSSAFKGTFLVQESHAFGNFRQPDCDSWVMTFSAAATTGAA